LFPFVSDCISATPGNDWVVVRQGLVKPVNHTLAQECTKPRKNHGALMTSISPASASHHQSPLQRLQQELQSEVSDG
ncbi:hypothetical protein ABTK20_23235, partial [Acinetobacter baumannii]